MRKPPLPAPDPFPLRWVRGVRKVRTTETITHYGTRDGYTTIRVYYRGWWRLLCRERSFSVARERNNEGCYTRSQRAHHIMGLLKANLGMVEETAPEIGPDGNEPTGEQSMDSTTATGSHQDESAHRVEMAEPGLTMSKSS